jgi:type 1 glutamine amidotransferase
MGTRRTTTVSVGAALLLAVAVHASFLSSPASAEDAKIKTLLLVGGSIHDWKGIGNVVEGLLKKSGKFDVTRVNDDLNALLADRIEPFDLVVFYWTVGKITEEQKRGVFDHIAKGKGFVTFHSGADSFRDDADWKKFVGGYFITHPHYRTYQVSVTDVKSPITAGITEFMITDEQYILKYDKDNITVLANALYKGETMPVIWTKAWGKGRVFYCALGHDPKACEQPIFQKILLRGCLWAAGEKVIH